jgi:hypothetical protein
MLFFAGLGVIFGGVAGLSAFLVTYEEYQHHGLARHRTFMESLRSGAVAFAFFLSAALAVGLFLHPAG